MMPLSSLYFVINMEPTFKSCKHQCSEAKGCEFIDTNDRLSQLPHDHVLMSIMSLLTMKEAGKTSVVSRTWYNLWHCLPVLFFKVNPYSKIKDKLLLPEQRSDLTANHGTVDILANKVCSRSIGGIPKDKAPSLTGTLMLKAGFEKLHVFPTFVAEFRIMGIALSGLKIDKLEVSNVANRPYKGFKALTRAGE